VAESDPFKWRHYQDEIILLCVRWYQRYTLSYRDLEETIDFMLSAKRDARAAKVNNTLYPNVIRSVGELHTRPDLEKLAIKFLDDADPEVVINAATMFPATQFRRPGICSKTTHKHRAIC
jgi:hypothetical protein